VVYSLLIGVSIWTVVDLGRHLMPSAAETGWPTGSQGVLLVDGGHRRSAMRSAPSWAIRSAAPSTCTAPRLREAHRGGPAQRRLITVLAGIAATYWFYSRNRSDYLERQVLEVRRHANEARLKLLETQLEPHMLFNTLANLRVLIGGGPGAGAADAGPHDRVPARDAGRLARRPRIRCKPSSTACATTWS
jgi:hypothetical protein